jgi:hypothetical protein
MSIPAGTHTFGPENGALWVRTGRVGAVAQVGHDLVILVTAWSATLAVGPDPSAWRVVLEADAGSLRVQEGVGGMQALGDEDKAGIDQTIDDEILQGTRIEFRSSSARESDDGHIAVLGELSLAGQAHPLEVDVAVGDDGVLRGRAVVTQSAWGITPYTTLFGALKVADDVEIVLDAAWSGELPAELAPWELEWKPTPLVDPGISSFLWTLVFFLYLWLGMAALGVAGGTALVIALVASFFVFLLVRTRGVGRNGVEDFEGEV